MSINKIAGALAIFFGGILLYSAWDTSSQSTFTFDVTVGPGLIYFGLKLLNYL